MTIIMIIQYKASQMTSNNRKWMSSKLITHSNQGKAMMNKRAMACNSNSKRDRDRNRYNQYNNNQSTNPSSNSSNSNNKNKKCIKSVRPTSKHTVEPT